MVAEILSNQAVKLRADPSTGGMNTDLAVRLAGVCPRPHPGGEYLPQLCLLARSNCGFGKMSPQKAAATWPRNRHNRARRQWQASCGAVVLPVKRSASWWFIDRRQRTDDCGTGLFEVRHLRTPANSCAGRLSGGHEKADYGQSDHRILSRNFSSLRLGCAEHWQLRVDV